MLSTPHPAAFVKSMWTSKHGLVSWYMALFQLPALPEAVARRTLAKSLQDSVYRLTLPIVMPTRWPNPER